MYRTLSVMFGFQFVLFSCNDDHRGDSTGDSDASPSCEADLLDSGDPAVCNGAPCNVEDGGPPVLFSDGGAEEPADLPPSHIILLVNDAVECTGNGRTWQAAFKTIQEALLKGRTYFQESDGDSSIEIWVAAGTYYVHQTRRSDTLRLFPGVALYGGFGGDETVRWERDPRSNLTEISGRNASSDERVYTVVTGADGAVVDGVLITGGNARDARYGGGMYNNDVSMRVSNCRFEQNYAGQSGGAMFNFNSTVLVTDCTFIDNDAGREGGAVFNLDSAVELRNSVFAFNHSWKVGGAVLNHSHSDTTFLNCTFYGNEVSDCGGAIADSHYSTSTIVNSILWHDQAAEAPELCQLDSYGEQIVSHSNIEGYVGGPFDLDVDPGFVDPEEADFHLRFDSPCINRGIDALAPETDRDGLSRIGGADMGAYEHQGDDR